MRGIYKKDYWLGLSYRTDGAIVTLLGLTYKDFIFGFAFDYATSKLSNFQAGTFELMLGYNIIKDPYSGRSRY